VTRIAVIGPGAMGATFAAALQQAGHEPALYGRTPVERIVVERDGEPPVTLASPVCTDPGAAAPAEWVLLAVKAHQTEGARPWLEALKPAVIVVLQNGVEHRELVAPLAGGARLLPAVSWCPA
jgi:2-dehydropantoate 2-reductase